MQYIYICVLAFVLGGCITTTVPSKSEYRIHTKTVATPVDAQKCKDKSLKVAQAFSSSKLMSHAMMYTLGNAKEFAYSESLWAQSPNSAITAKFVRLLRDADVFKSVQISKSRSSNDFILEISVDEFIQHFTQDSSASSALVGISLTLIDVKTNNVVGVKNLQAEVAVKELNAYGGVIALSQALDKVLEGTNQWMNGVCK